MKRQTEVLTEILARRCRCLHLWIPAMVIAVFFTGIALADPPATEEKSEQPAAGGTPKDQPSEQPTATDDEAEAIKRLIRKRMKESERTPREQPTQLRQPPKSLTTQPSAKGKAGCGSSGKSAKLNLEPPPADQPQPRLVVENETIELEPLWRGQHAVFTFKIRNEGEGVLNFKARGG